MAILAAYNFASALTASSNDASITAGTVTKNSLLTDLTNGTAGYASDNIISAAPTASAIDASSAVTNGSYLFFTITPISGKQFSLTTLTFDIARGGASTPRGYDVRSSADDFATTLGTANLTAQRPTFQSVSIDVSGASFQNVTGTITFRIYVYAPLTSNNIDIDNITINGSVADAGTVEQEGFRFRDDDGNETTAAWLAAQDTNIIRATGSNTRLRVVLNSTLDRGSENYQLEYRKVGESTWNVIDVAP